MDLDTEYEMFNENTRRDVDALTERVGWSKANKILRDKAIRAYQRADRKTRAFIRYALEPILQ